MHKFKVISHDLNPTLENFEKFGEDIEWFVKCPCRAIRELKYQESFEGFILDMETFQLYSISNERNGASQLQIYIKTLITLEQLQDKLLPILFDDNDKFEDVNRANILYDRETKRLTIKRTKFDFVHNNFIDRKIMNEIIRIVGHLVNVEYAYPCNAKTQPILFVIDNIIIDD